MAARSAFAYSRAAAAISSAGTPGIPSAPDVPLVVQALPDDDVGHGVEQRDVRADVEPQVPLRQTRQLDVARVGDDEARAVSHRLLDAQRDDGMRLSRVGADDHYQRRPLQLRDRVAHRPPSYHDRQTGDRGSVSGTSAVIDVVGADNRAGELLEQVVRLADGAGGGPQAEGA